jgi:hypothetical protein
MGYLGNDLCPSKTESVFAVTRAQSKAQQLQVEQAAADENVREETHTSRVGLETGVIESDECEELDLVTIISRKQIGRLGRAN